VRHTRIVATIGPACDTDAIIEQMIVAGVDVFRLNFSHGTRETHAASLGRVRAAADRLGRVVAVLQDLAGPKIRSGRLIGGQPVHLEAGSAVTIATGDFPGDARRLSTSDAELARSVRPGDRLLLDDGRIELRVQETTGTEIRAIVLDGGELGERKGITAPGVRLPALAVTPGDAEDLRFGLEIGVDFVGVSFVQTAADLERAREVAAGVGARDAPLVAKLERPDAITHLTEVLVASDAVMVARGDLGLELPLERVPGVQKIATFAARERGVPVIVATQVLESMRTETRPTRAEVSDAANAVEDGVDAILLAGETAIGAHPVRAVQTLDAILREAERTAIELPNPLRPGAIDTPIARAIGEAAVSLTRSGDAHAIVAVTHGGTTARLLSALRPRVPVFAATPRPEIARRLQLHRSVSPLVLDIPHDPDRARTIVAEALLSRGLVPPGAVTVFVGIDPDLARVNFLKLQRL
jgi:pyruvate kinase